MLANIKLWDQALLKVDPWHKLVSYLLGQGVKAGALNADPALAFIEVDRDQSKHFEGIGVITHLPGRKVAAAFGRDDGV